jgi:uncharacterized membrane protein YGL010W
MEFSQDEDVSSPDLSADIAAHRGPRAVATVFLTVAEVVLALGLLGAVATGVSVHQALDVSVGRSIAYACAVALGVVFLASLLAFFGYVLDLLIEIAENIRSIAIDLEDDDLEDSDDEEAQA